MFQRHPDNPILTARDWPYPVNTVFNAGATLLHDGRTVLMVRCEEHTGFSHLTRAVSVDGYSGWEIDASPTFTPHPDHPDEQWGVEDPRLTWIPEMDAWMMAYTAFGPGGPRVALARTKDFVEFERLGPATLPHDKDACLLPRRINGDWMMIRRPARFEGAYIWISHSEDLITWSEPKIVLRARSGGWWDAPKVGLSAPLIETEEGWLMLYHAARTTAGGALYRQGLALLDLEQPWKALLRGDEWVFGPDELYERVGDVPNVVFSCGWTQVGDEVRMYYGGADSVMAVATASLGEMLSWLKKKGRPVGPDGL